MSVVPATSQPRNHSFHAAPAQPQPKRARSGGRPYTPGMFDKLIDHPVLTPDHAPPEQVAGVHVELAPSGRGVIVAEQLRGGACGLRHLLDLIEPHSVFMRLADGREVWVEIRAVEPAPEEDREPWSAPVTAFVCLEFLPR